MSRRATGRRRVKGAFFFPILYRRHAIALRDGSLCPWGINERLTFEMKGKRRITRRASRRV